MKIIKYCRGGMSMLLLQVFQVVPSYNPKALGEIPQDYV